MKKIKVETLYHSTRELEVLVDDSVDKHGAMDPENWIEIESENEIDFWLYDVVGIIEGFEDETS